MKPSTETMTRRSFLIKSALTTGIATSAGTLLEACGGGSGGGSSPSQVTLTFADWMAKGEDHPILNDFMKANPTIKVVDQTLPGATYDQALKPRLIAGNGPDVMLFMDSQYIPFVQQGWLADVTDQAGSKVQSQSQDLNNHYLLNGKIYGAMVNGNFSDQPVFYNKKTFAKLGLTIPTTLDQFYALCEKLKSSGTDALVFGGKDVWPISALTSGYEQASKAAKYGPTTNTDLLLAKGQASIEDIYGASWRFFADLMQKGDISKASGTLTYDQSVQYFVDGKAALLPQGPWVPGLDAVKQADPASFALGSFSFPLPKYQNKVVTSLGPDRSIGVYAHSKHPQEAKQLYNFFLQQENLKKYLEGQNLYSIMPGVNPAMDASMSSYYKDHGDTSLYDVLISQATQDPHAAKVSIPSGFSDALGQVYPNILAGAGYSEELHRVQDAFNRVKSQIIVTNG